MTLGQANSCIIALALSEHRPTAIRRQREKKARGGPWSVTVERGDRHKITYYDAEWLVECELPGEVLS